MKKFGIDISAWQGNYDLERAKAQGVEFVIIRGGTGERMGTDGCFEQNYKKAKALGLPVGVYWFSASTSVEGAVKEADFFYENCIKGKQFELPVYMDIELETQFKLGKRAVTDIVKAFCARLESKKLFVGVYSSESFFSSYMYDDELKRYAHWVANWSRSTSYDCGMWQFGGSTNLIRSPYVAGVVTDQNYMYEDYPTIIKEAGLNGFGEPASPFSVGDRVWIDYKVSRVHGDLIDVTDGVNTVTVTAEHLRKS